MCLITTTALAAGGTALTMGIGGLSVTTGALATTAAGAGLLTAGAVAGSAALGAAASAGIAAATGGSGKDVRKAALIGGVTGGVLSGFGSLGALTSAAKTAADTADTAKTAKVAADTAKTAKTAADMEGVGVPLTGERLALAQLSGGYTDVAQGVQTTAETAKTTAASGMTTAEKISLGVGIGTGVLQGVQAYGENEAAKDAAKIQRQQADLERMRAGQEMDAAQQEAIDAARKAKQRLGTGKAQMAANGVMMDDTRAGSEPMVYEGDAAAELAYDQAKIMHNAQLRAWGYQENARVLDAQAADTLRAGRRKARAGYISAAISGLNAGVNTYASTKTLLS